MGGLPFKYGEQHSGVRVKLPNGEHHDIFWGMAAQGAMNQFVMGVFLSTATYTYCADGQAGTTTREGGVYPLYADFSDPSMAQGGTTTPKIRLGPDLLTLSKEELKSFMNVKWEWNKFASHRRQCGMGLTLFQKNVLDCKAEIQKSTRAGAQGKGKWSDQQGVRSGSVKRSKKEVIKIDPALRKQILALRKDNWIEVGRGQVCTGTNCLNTRY
jgi:hypothetical protein